MAIKYTILKTRITPTNNVLIDFVCTHGKHKPVKGTVIVGSDVTPDDIDNILNLTVYDLTTTLDERRRIRQQNADAKKAKHASCRVVKAGLDAKIGDETIVHQPHGP